MFSMTSSRRYEVYFLVIFISVTSGERGDITDRQWIGIRLDGSVASFARYDHPAPVVCRRPHTDNRTGSDVTPLEDGDDDVSSTTVVSFEFRTRSKTGLLFYAERGEGRGFERVDDYDDQFILVRLVRGTVQLRYDIEDHGGRHAVDDEGDGSTSQVAVGEELNDGHWHTVTVSVPACSVPEPSFDPEAAGVDSEVILALTVDGITETPSSSQGPVTLSAVDYDDGDDDLVSTFYSSDEGLTARQELNYQPLPPLPPRPFKPVKLNGGAYVGGLPSSTRRRPIQLAVPSVAFERHFRGDVRRLCVNDGRQCGDGPAVECTPVDRRPSYLVGGSVLGGVDEIVDGKGAGEGPGWLWNGIGEDDGKEGKRESSTEFIDRCSLADEREYCQNDGVCIDPLFISTSDVVTADSFANRTLNGDGEEPDVPVCECDRTDFTGPLCDVGLYSEVIVISQTAFDLFACLFIGIKFKQ